eukprot:TRINITY_DN56928_c0_g1_i1.p1 TRINITY_DN56928_c0_g1~~TRINITY_DN56928_c0_g1_i1.p1  ORF type:complete len:608 (-),score=64.64 TRINITY_DN56928_c0_g1_i1:61-1884(-)
MSHIPTVVYVDVLDSSSSNMTWCGEYVRVEESVNDQPLWHKRSSSLWLGSTTGGHWVITDRTAVDKGLLINTGYLKSCEPHFGLMPERMVSGWTPIGSDGVHKISVTVGFEMPMGREPPHKLVFEAASSGGVFEVLVEDGQRHGYPVWKNPQKNLYLTSSIGGFWVITDHKAYESGVLTDVGYHRSAKPHRGKFPHEIDCGWMGLSEPDVNPSVHATVVVPSSRPSEDPPLTLHLQCDPNYQSNLCGEYTLVAGETANEMPLWKNEHDNWLASSAGGVWLVTDTEARQNGFKVNMGFIKSRNPHAGVLPHSITNWVNLRGYDFECKFVKESLDIGTGIADASDSVADTKPSSQPTLKVASMPSRIRADEIAGELSIMPFTKWADVCPQRGCVDELRENSGIRARLPDVDRIAEDVEMKTCELRFEPETKALAGLLDTDELQAIVAYTHDLCQADGKKDGNLYWEENNALRCRTAEGRGAMMLTWSTHIVYMLRGLSKLPCFEGAVYRGISQQAELHNYEEGRPIQWGAWTSTTQLLDVAQQFTGVAGAIFKIKVFTGKDITNLSFFKAEGEILLSPNHRFIVVRPAYVEDGYTYVDLLETKGSFYIF